MTASANDGFDALRAALLPAPPEEQDAVLDRIERQARACVAAGHPVPAWVHDRLRLREDERFEDDADNMPV